MYPIILSAETQIQKNCHYSETIRQRNKYSILLFFPFFSSSICVLRLRADIRIYQTFFKKFLKCLAQSEAVLLKLLKYSLVFSITTSGMFVPVIHPLETVIQGQGNNLGVYERHCNVPSSVLHGEAFVQVRESPWVHEAPALPRRLDRAVVP